MKTLKDAKVGETLSLWKSCTARALSSAASWTWASPRAWRCTCARWRRLGDPMELNVRGYELSVRQGGCRND